MIEKMLLFIGSNKKDFFENIFNIFKEMFTLINIIYTVLITTYVISRKQAVNS
jgi:SNF2 family DNA or RNA helicase